MPSDTHLLKATSQEVELCAAALGLVSVAVVSTYWVPDPDLWGHLRFGLDILHSRGLESTDPYSFTADLPWINHEWLSELAMGVAFTVGESLGLQLLKVALLLSAFAVILRLLRPLTAVQWWCVAVVSFAAAPIAKTLRPQLWTILALAILWWTVTLGDRARYLIWPILFALWANLHGGWIVGLGGAAAWIAGASLDAKRPLWPAISAWGLATAATLVNPYGSGLWRFIWGTVGLERDITEWRPIWQQDASALALWVLVAGTAIALGARGRWQWGPMLPVLMMAAASTRVGRLIGLFGITTVALLGNRWRPSGIALTTHQKRMIHGVTMAAAGCCGLVMIATQARCLSLDAWPGGPDRVAAGLLRGASGRLMVPFDWGQYALWHFGPDLKVSMDGRRETVYSPTRLAEQTALDQGDPAILSFIGRERPEYVWLVLPQGETLRPGLLVAGYRQELATGLSAIFARSDLPALTPGSMEACFP